MKKETTMAMMQKQNKMSFYLNSCTNSRCRSTNKWQIFSYSLFLQLQNKYVKNSSNIGFAFNLYFSLKTLFENSSYFNGENDIISRRHFYEIEFPSGNFLLVFLLLHLYLHLFSCLRAHKTNIFQYCYDDKDYYYYDY